MTLSRLQQIQAMLIDEPQDSFLNYALALEHANLNDLHKAIELLELLISTDKNYLGAYYQLGKYYEQNRNTEKAISTYKNGLVVARLQKNFKTVSELNEALTFLED